jgi:hypothetical protein
MVDCLAGRGVKPYVIGVDIEAQDAEDGIAYGRPEGGILLILIAGQCRFRRVEGGMMEFISFPARPGTPSGLKGVRAFAAPSV